MGLIRVTGILEVDDENIDENDPSGLTEYAWNKVRSMFPSLDDIETEIVEEEE